MMMIVMMVTVVKLMKEVEFFSCSLCDKIFSFFVLTVAVIEG